MVNQKKYQLLLQLGLVIAVIILLAGGLSRVEFQSGRPFDLFAYLFQGIRPPGVQAPIGTGGGSGLINALQPIFWGMLGLALIYAVVSPRYRKQLIRMLVTVAALVLLLSRIQELQWAGEGFAEESLGGDTLEPVGATLPEPPPFFTDPPDWFLVAINVLLALLFFGILWYLWRVLRRRPDTKTLLVQEAETALSDLEAGGDLRDVVLRCYAGMTQVLRESRNIERRKAMTPREFENHLAETGIQDEHIVRLTQLFEGVRYGARPSAGRTELEAMACLRAIVQAYGRAS
jgi:hypothetical protein